MKYTFESSSHDQTNLICPKDHKKNPKQIIFDIIIYVRLYKTPLLFNAKSKRKRNQFFLEVILVYLSLTQLRPNDVPVFTFLNPELAAAFVFPSPASIFSLYLPDPPPPPLPLLPTSVVFTVDWLWSHRSAQESFSILYETREKDLIYFSWREIWLNEKMYIFN